MSLSLPNFKIFVSIASYRDSECSNTIQDLFEKAKYPNRLFVGCCQQNKENASEEECLPKNFQWKHQIRMIHIPYSEAKGPTYARYICSTLHKDESFFFQIDSHNKFVQNWDDLCVQMFLDLSNRIGHSKIILSHYPADIRDYKVHSDKNEKVPTIESANYNEKGILKLNAAVFRSVNDIPQKTYFIAAGFLFTTKEWLKEVPFDPSLDYLFVGEEILLTLRSFTSGWDVFTPNRNIIYHYYYRKNCPKIWFDQIKKPKKAIEKVLKLQNGDMNHMWGLGDTRPIQEFYQKIDRHQVNDIFLKKTPTFEIIIFCLIFLLYIARNFLYVSK